MVCFCCSYCPTFQIFVASLPMEAWLGGNLYQNNKMAQVGYGWIWKLYLAKRRTEYGRVLE